MDDERKSVAVDVIQSLVYGESHRDEPCYLPTRHLRSFVGADGRLSVFLLALATYVEEAEKKARKDTL